MVIDYELAQHSVLFAHNLDEKPREVHSRRSHGEAGQLMVNMLSKTTARPRERQHTMCGSIGYAGYIASAASTIS